MSKGVILPECNKDIGNLRSDILLSPNDKKEGTIGLISRFLRLDSLSKRNSPATDPSAIYYGVYIPCEIKKGPDEETLHVYKNKAEAMELVRRYKLSRFKAFQSRQDAVSFALRGAETTDTTDGHDNSVMGEKPYPFKAPSPQDMVSLRKAIESGLCTTVRDKVWDNPRYLISSGSTPAILQEGSRYNALHIAAKSQNAEICNLILTSVSNPTFVQKLYGSDSDIESCKDFASILLDRYLNTPDKAMNETPLHFAAKFGAEQVVDVLSSFPQCNKQAVNKFGEQPKDIICKRAPNSNPEVARRIAAMLLERFYVPVLHSEDGSAVPVIGRPFTPAEPPEINRDPLSPRYEIRAFAGPMEAKDAENFRRKWKTRPRSAPATFRLKEMTKGLETVGRDLAEQMKIGWKEYWPFLDTFTDLRSHEGLLLFENYLKVKYDCACSLAYNNSCTQLQTPNDLSISRISLGNITQTPTKDISMSPMSELCVAMKSCTISSDRPAHWRKTDPIRQRLCRQPTGKLPTNLLNGDSTPVTNHTNHTVSQLLCIERTCQVFAKRIADALNFSLTAEPEVAGDSLKAEAKHLQHTMCTYMDDERFQNINFSLIHSRLAQLVVYKLKQQTKELDDINNLVEFLAKLRCPNDDIFSSDDERKPLNYRGCSRVQMNQAADGHVRCLASFICEELTETDITKGPSMCEQECTEVWEKASKCPCEWKIEMFERNSKKNASFRKNRSILSTSPKSESIIRRLTFENDIGDCKSLNGESEQTVGSANTPSGDTGAVLYTLDVSKCRVEETEISDDDSVTSATSVQPSEDEYITASEYSSDEELEDASDVAIVETFIYGEQPTKMDRLVFEVLRDHQIAVEQYPNVYRWRHNVALYSYAEASRWPEALLDDSNDATTRSVPTSPCTPRAINLTLVSCSTPNRETRRDDCDRNLSLQVSNWLRVTGPNSPRSALANRSIHNVSFGC